MAFKPCLNICRRKCLIVFNCSSGRCPDAVCVCECVYAREKEEEEKKKKRRVYKRGICNNCAILVIGGIFFRLFRVAASQNQKN